MSRLTLLVLLAIALPLAAAPATRDFAWQAPLDPAEDSLQRVELPLDVVLALTRPDLGDLAVFDAQGKPLPHSVLQTPASEMPMTRELPFHEFTRYLEQHSRIVTTREQNLEPGAVTERETTETQAIKSERHDYLIELSADDRQFDYQRLELEWRHQPASRLLELEIEAGDELDRLRVVQQRKSLTNRESGDPGWRSIENIPSRTRYLRLRPLDGIDSFELLRVTGHYTESRPAPRVTQVVDVESFEDDSGSYYRFMLPSAVKPVAMRILPADSHAIIAGDLYALWDGVENKRLLRADFRQHNIDSEGVSPSQPLALPRRALGEIRFTSKTGLDAPPRVELLYPRYEVVFLGDGNPPYSLAWGNRDSEAQISGLVELLDGDLLDAHRNSRAVALGDPRPAGGPARLEARSSLPWLKWLLWALLLAAVLITGRMAMRLYREMNTADSA